jgi:hypothetical protein
VWHAAVSAKALRPTIEFDLLPARETSLAPFYAGLAGWYPWFPTEANLVEGTRLALAQCYPEQPDKGLKIRLRRLLGKR